MWTRLSLLAFPEDLTLCTEGFYLSLTVLQLLNIFSVRLFLFSHLCVIMCCFEVAVFSLIVLASLSLLLVLCRLAFVYESLCVHCEFSSCLLSWGWFVFVVMLFWSHFSWFLRFAFDGFLLIIFAWKIIREYFLYLCLCTLLVEPWQRPQKPLQNKIYWPKCVFLFLFIIYNNMNSCSLPLTGTPTINLNS